MSAEAGERQIETNALERCVSVILFSPNVRPASLSLTKLRKIRTQS